MKQMDLIQVNKIAEYVGIYVHIPFCKAKCTYCNFNSYVIPEGQTNDLHNQYINAVISEIQSYKSELKDSKIDTIFIGGGTPSILISGGISKIMSAIKENFNVLETVEATLEVNPSTFLEESAKEWLNAGINRISVGLQTSNDKILKFINRTHTKEQFISTIKTLKKVGFKSINADLMLGLPLQEVKDVKHSLKLLYKLGVNHVSAYSLILEDHTRLKRQVEKGEVVLPPEEQSVKMYDLVYKFLKKRGFLRYEVSNFAKVGKECKHNINCWRMHYYLGFGAGAHSFYKNKRHSNALLIHEYINEIIKNNHAKSIVEDIDMEELFEETILLGMRISNGIDLKQIKNDFNIDLLKQKENEINDFLKHDVIAIKDDRLFLTPKGYYVLNKIILNLVS